MKLRIDQQNLINAVNIVSKAVPSKTSMSILECILIDADTEKIRMIANDMEFGIETSVQGTIEDHGIIAIDAGIFGNIVRKLPAGEVILRSEGEQVEISCGQAVFNILGRDGHDFPYLPEIEKENGIEMSQFTLRDVISRTIFSVSTNDTNKMMTGELFEIQDQTLRVVALDGHRISIRTVGLARSYDNRKVIIPGKSLSELCKILSGDMEKKAGIYFTQKHALFSFDDTIVVTRLIEGEYFNIDQMLSTQYSTHVSVNRQEFLSCLDRALLLVKEEDKKPIVLMIKQDTMGIKIRTALGRMDEDIAITKDGEDLNIGFNPRFLLDALRAIDEENIDIYLMNSRAPAFIRNDSTFCYLVLPVNFISV